MYLIAAIIVIIIVIVYLAVRPTTKESYYAKGFTGLDRYFEKPKTIVDAVAMETYYPDRYYRNESFIGTIDKPVTLDTKEHMTLDEMFTANPDILDIKPEPTYDGVYYSDPSKRSAQYRSYLNNPIL